MAKADVIENAIASLNKVVEDEQFKVDVLMEVGGDEVPLAVLMLKESHYAVAHAVALLVRTVRENALPYLADLDRAGNGGMGAVAPMVTTVMAGQSAPSRT